MQIRILPSARIRRNYNEISEICRKEKAPVFLTKNGGGDLVVMAIEQFLQREQQILLREKLADIEKRRRAGTRDVSFRMACKRLQEIVENYKLMELTQESEYPEREEKSSEDGRENAAPRPAES